MLNDGKLSHDHQRAKDGDDETPLMRLSASPCFPHHGDVTEYEPSTYGDRMASGYDTWPGLPADAGAAAAFLAGLAGEGPLLELGIGTGRVALPLAERGLEVHGIDASEAMIARLREKAGGERIRVAVGDFADVRAPGGPYRLVFVVFNTLFALLSQQDQGRCFRNVAGALGPGGTFVIQAFVPDLARFDRGQRVQAGHVGLDEVQLEVSSHDPATQRVESMHVVLREEGVRLYPIRLRYAWPSELDLMGGAAGLRLRERWSGWSREPFTADSTNHVSVYEKP